MSLLKLVGVLLDYPQDALWQQYEARLHEAGVDRDWPMPAAGGHQHGGGCGHH